jgi:hypothetical protein
MREQKTHLIVLLAFFLVGCGSDTGAQSSADATPPNMGMDAGPGSDDAAPPMGDAAPVPGDAGPPPGARAPIFITTMTHLEGNWRYEGPMGERKFMGDVGKIRLAMSTFAAHGAKLTVESEIPFSTAAIESGSEIFTELLESGHGVGTHCDITPGAPRMEAEAYAQEFIARKTPMDMLIGADNNLGCSGGQSRSDWILGAHLAGFRYVNGPVAFGFLSMPEENRPEGWTDEYILDEGHFHANIPLELVDRIHPYMMADATDMVPDEDGVVLLSSGGMGRLDAMSEREDDVDCAPMCSFDDRDVTLAIAAIDGALAVHDPTRVGKLTFYFPLANFNENNIPYITTFLSRVNAEYIATGRLQWATQKELYEAYVEWNE